MILDEGFCIFTQLASSISLQSELAAIRSIRTVHPAVFASTHKKWLRMNGELLYLALKVGFRLAEPGRDKPSLRLQYTPSARLDVWDWVLEWQ